MDLLALAERLEATAAELRAAHSADTSTAELPFDGWREWAGGDEPPEDTRGKVVGVRLRSGEESVGPAGVWGWNRYPGKPARGDIVAYRIAAEQPES